uniref:NOT2_3_5 domain-containing protein n=1 Tax=Steinernema glaseri TaxID=37863 RepID=A0A1I7YH99_9BILA
MKPDIFAEVHCALRRRDGGDMNRTGRAAQILFSFRRFAKIVVVRSIWLLTELSIITETIYYAQAMRLSSMNSGTAFSADRNSIQPTCRSAAAQSFPSDTTINDSEFPSLGVRQTASPYTPIPTTSFSSSPVPHSQTFSPKDVFNTASQSRTPYASLMRPTDGSPALNSTNPEFHMQSEDFPALPGSNPGDSLYNNGQSSSAQNSTEPLERMPARPSVEVKSGIKTLPDGTVTNIPPTMLADQFGMAGLLTFIRAIDSDRSIIQLALGSDLTNLGLNINASDYNKTLYGSFGGPWADHSCRVQDLEAKVPEEYITDPQIREKLPPIKLNKFSEDVLFYLYYNYPKEVYQLAAANELYNRDWRFHKYEQMWLTRSQYGGVKEQTNTYEKGSYNVFDPQQWRKIPKDMTLEYKMLEDKPKMATDGYQPRSMGGIHPHMVPQPQGFFPGQSHMHAQQNSAPGAAFNHMAAVHHHGSGMHPPTNNGSTL